MKLASVRDSTRIAWRALFKVFSSSKRFMVARTTGHQNHTPHAAITTSPNGGSESLHRVIKRPISPAAQWGSRPRHVFATQATFGYLAPLWATMSMSSPLL